MTDLTIPAGSLPSPGEVVELQLSSTLVALIEHTGEPTEDVDDPTPDEQAASPVPLITYTVVDVVGATRTHAARVRRRAERTRVDRHPLCSRSGSRIVRGRRRDLDLSVVTCTQCRRQLEAEGEL